MDVTALVARLQALGVFGQVVAAEPAGSAVNFDTATALRSLLGSLVSGRMFPLTQDEDPAHPSIVYTLVGSEPSSIEGFAVNQTDAYALHVRATDYDELIAVVDSVKTAIAGAAAAISVTDVAHDYEDAAKLCAALLEVAYTYLHSGSQALPAAFVYCGNRSALASEFDNLTKQRLDTHYHIVLATVDGNMHTLAAAVMQSLLGWQETPAHMEMEYVSGGGLDGLGGLQLWRETYVGRTFVTESP